MITLDPNHFKQFLKAMNERGEKNKSAVIEDLMVCWTYTDPKTHDCMKGCPRYEEEEDAKSS